MLESTGYVKAPRYVCLYSIIFILLHVSGAAEATAVRMQGGCDAAAQTVWGDVGATAAIIAGDNGHERGPQKGLE